MTTATIEAPRMTSSGRLRRGRLILADYTVGAQRRRLWAIVSVDGIAVVDELRAPLADAPDERQVEPHLADGGEAEALARDYISEAAYHGEPPVTKKLPRGPKLGRRRAAEREALGRHLGGFVAGRRWASSQEGRGHTP
jgi:hypothetical protein